MGAVLPFNAPPVPRRETAVSDACLTTRLEATRRQVDDLMAARDAAFAQGAATGRASAEAEAKLAEADAMNAFADRLGSVLGALQAERERVAREAAGLALAIGEALAGAVGIAASAGAVVHEAIEAGIAGPRLRLRVAPAHAEAVAAAVAARFADRCAIDVEGDPALSGRDCIALGEVGRVELLADERLAAVRERLRPLL